MKDKEFEKKRKQFRNLIDNLADDNSLAKQTVDVAILDRSEKFCDTYTKLLEEHGLTVFATKNEFDYIPFIGEITPQIIILSFEIPSMNGCEICSRLKQKIGYYKIPICITVNDDSLDLEVLKKKYRADKIISKNWGATDELELLDWVLARIKK